ncbi:MAG: type II toxin-antitoxin system HicA family toxin [Prolixibacteraceae bacterium]
MSKLEKLIIRLISLPKDFTYQELKTVLLAFGYAEMEGSDSRICFKKETHKIKLHKPYPGNIMKRYQLDLVIEELKKQGFI